MSGTSNHTGCFIYASVKRVNNASFLGIVGFEGIPQNFVINIFTWLAFYIIFIFIRKKAWNYGRMAVVQKEELKWADMFYGEDQEAGSMGSFGSGSGRALVVASNTSEHVNRQSGDSANTYDDDDGVGGATSYHNNIRPSMDSDDYKDSFVSGSNANTSKKNEIKDTGYFTWIKIVFNLTDKEYRDKCGPDCVYYLSFQRHLIFLALIVTFFSLAVILPINVSRTVMGEVMEDNFTVKKVGFSDTTIINLGARYEFLWFHIVLSMIFLLISVVVMRHFSKKLKFSEDDDEDFDYHTICIIGINKEKCDENLLRAHLEETYPGIEITEISFAYDISKLQQAEFKRLSAASAKIYFQEAYEKNKDFSDGVKPRMRPFLCGYCRCSRWCCKDTDAIEYYAKCEEEFTKQVEEERKKSLTKPVGIVYVTFKSIESAENLVEDYACTARLFLNAPVSKYTNELHSNQWIVKYAPQPEDIYWENLSTDYKVWWAKFAALNVLVIVIAVIFSTPVSVFQSVTFLPVQRSNGSANTQKASDWLKLHVVSGLISDTIPGIILWILSVCLIYVVGQSDYIIGFWTKTACNLSEMTKTFFFLVLMVVILPSLGITSIRYFFDKEKNIAWSCIFYKDNGASFVNYVCISSLTGTAAELMRLPELFMYAIKLMLAKSQAETAAIRKSLLWDFQIGVAYAWVMLHFAILICFSVIYPLVTPFGLLYLLMKHFVDRYNIYFAYAPCKVDKDVHNTAVNFVIMSMFMLQLNLLAYVHFHIGENLYHDSSIGTTTDSKIRALQICSLLEFSITAAFFLGQCCFNICADLSPFNNRARDGKELRETESGTVGGSTRRSRASELSNKSIAGDLLKSAAAAAAVEAPPGADANEDNDTEDSFREGIKPYGKYIPPILRPELVRLALEAVAAEENDIQDNVDVQVQTLPVQLEQGKTESATPERTKESQNAALNRK